MPAKWTQTNPSETIRQLVREWVNNNTQGGEMSERGERFDAAVVVYEAAQQRLLNLTEQRPQSPTTRTQSHDGGMGMNATNREIHPDSRPTTRGT